MVCSEDNPPVLILGYRRYVELSRIAEVILTSGPCCLFVALDGDEHRGEEETTALKEFLAGICSPSTNLHFIDRTENVGIAKNLTFGMNAVLDSHESAIVLEDDCLPSHGFYSFMKHSLDVFAGDASVGMISGNSTRILRAKRRYAESSFYPQTWGWATWRKNWIHFDPRLSRYSESEIDSAIETIQKSPLIRKHWKKRVRHSREDRNMWDAQWSVYMWMNRWKSVNPSLELVSNIGLDEKATHTKSPSVFLNAPLSIEADEVWSETDFVQCREWSWIRRAQYLWVLRLDVLQQFLHRMGLMGVSNFIRNFLVSSSR